MASVVDLGGTRYRGTPPETEDHLIYPPKARWSEALSDSDFWKLLLNISIQLGGYFRSRPPAPRQDFHCTGWNRNSIFGLLTSK